MCHLSGSNQSCEWELSGLGLLSPEYEIRILVHLATPELRLDIAAEAAVLMVTDELLQLVEIFLFLFPRHPLGTFQRIKSLNGGTFILHHTTLTA